MRTSSDSRAEPICKRRAQSTHRHSPSSWSLRASPPSAKCAPVGALKSSRYASTSFQLQVDDVLVAYTDGVTESQDIEGNGFGQKRLEGVLLDCRSGDPNKVLQLILDELSAHSAGCPQKDDIALVVVKVVEREAEVKLEQPGA